MENKTAQTDKSNSRRKTVLWAKVIDARNGESYSGSLTESKGREKRRKKPNKKNRGEIPLCQAGRWGFETISKQLAGRPRESNCGAAYLKTQRAVFRGIPQSAIHQAQGF
jgi:hypothetical protein